MDASPSAACLSQSRGGFRSLTFQRRQPRASKHQKAGPLVLGSTLAMTDLRTQAPTCGRRRRPGDAGADLGTQAPTCGRRRRPPDTDADLRTQTPTCGGSADRRRSAFRPTVGVCDLWSAFRPTVGVCWVGRGLRVSRSPAHLRQRVASVPGVGAESAASLGDFAFGCEPRRVRNGRLGGLPSAITQSNQHFPFRF